MKSNLDRRLQALEERGGAPAECQCQYSTRVVHENPTSARDVDGPAECPTCGKRVRTTIVIQRVSYSDQRGAA